MVSNEIYLDTKKFIQVNSELLKWISISYCAVYSVVTIFYLFLLSISVVRSNGFRTLKKEYCHYSVNVETLVAIVQNPARV